VPVRARLTDPSTTDDTLTPTPPKEPSVRTTRVAAGVALAASSLLAAATPAAAWPVPSVRAAGGTCTGSVRSPVTWSAVNLETVFPRSPARIANVVVTPSFPTAAFLPGSLPNNGSATATTTTVVPASFTGDVRLTFQMVWAGQDGSDQEPGTATVHVVACPQAGGDSPSPTTTTTVTPTPGQQQSPSTTTTTPTQVVDGETVTPEGQPVTAVRAVAVTATPTFTG
jgi:hypothetical protein